MNIFEFATASSQRDELLELVRKVVNDDLPIIVLATYIAKCEVQNG